MTIHEKLERLTEFSSMRAVSLAAKLGANTLGNILNKKTQVTTPVAAALARVLKVDAGWLIDDRKRWPPVRIESSEPAHAA